MFNQGTVPFIFANKTANHKITTEELSEIETRVTRRGSVFSAALVALVLGARNYGHNVPDIKVVNIPNISVIKFGDWLTKGANGIYEVARSPLKLILSLALIAGVEKAISKLTNNEQATASPSVE